MLNWEEFHEDDTPVAAQPTEAAPTPPPSAKPQPAPPAEAVAESRGSYRVAEGDRLARARKSLEELDVAAGLEERSEEHTSELQSRPHLVCRLLLEKKKH